MKSRRFLYVGAVWRLATVGTRSLGTINNDSPTRTFLGNEIKIFTPEMKQTRL